VWNSSSSLTERLPEEDDVALLPAGEVAAEEERDVSLVLGCLDGLSGLTGSSCRLLC
jgi:hypothetical protein